MLDGRQPQARTSLRPGQRVSVEMPKAIPLELVPEAIPLDIIYSDSFIAVINKQRGLVVHPAAGNFSGTLVHALLHHMDDFAAIAGTVRPGIVHRLDKDTTGVMVVAKNDIAMNSLGEQIKQRSMERYYLALVWGRMREERGRIDLPIARHPRLRKRMAVQKDGREAITEYRVLAEYSRYSLLELKLQTGRTHQIRVHLSHIGHAIVGDAVYGAKPNSLGMTAQALHAARLVLNHPFSGERCTYEAALPQDFREAVKYVEEVFL